MKTEKEKLQELLDSKYSEGLKSDGSSKINENMEMSTHVFNFSF